MASNYVNGSTTEKGDLSQEGCREGVAPLVWSSGVVLEQEEADRNPTKDRSPEGKLVLTRLHLVLFWDRCSAGSFICKYERMTKDHQTDKAVQQQGDDIHSKSPSRSRRIQEETHNF